MQLMTTESQLTTHQEWTKLSGEIQLDVNRVLGEFATEIAATNVVLADLYCTDPEAAGEYSTNIVEYLDDRWGYQNDEFMVVGKWYEPIIEMTDEGVLSRHVKTEAFRVVRSNGFMVKPTELEGTDDEVPRVGLSFIVSTIGMSTPSIQGNVQVLGFAEPEEISLQYMRPGDTSVVSSSLSEVGETLVRLDSLLLLHTRHGDSSFYRQSQKKQQSFIRSVIDSAAEVLPSPETKDQLLLDGIKTLAIHVKSSGTKEVSHLYAKELSQPFLISGEVLGVTLPDILEHGFEKKYDSPDDFIAAGEGLGLIVEPHETNVDLSKFENPICVIPIRAVRKLVLGLI